MNSGACPVVISCGSQNTCVRAPRPLSGGTVAVQRNPPPSLQRVLPPRVSLEQLLPVARWAEWASRPVDGRGNRGWAGFSDARACDGVQAPSLFRCLSVRRGGRIGGEVVLLASSLSLSSLHGYREERAGLSQLHGSSPRTYLPSYHMRSEFPGTGVGTSTADLHPPLGRKVQQPPAPMLRGQGRPKKGQRWTGVAHGAG